MLNHKIQVYSIKTYETISWVIETLQQYTSFTVTEHNISVSHLLQKIKLEQASMVQHVVARWTAGQQVERSILLQGHDS